MTMIRRDTGLLTSQYPTGRAVDPHSFFADPHSFFADPHSFFADPDPAAKKIRIWIQLKTNR